MNNQCFVTSLWKSSYPILKMLTAKQDDYNIITDTQTANRGTLSTRPIFWCLICLTIKLLRKITKSQQQNVNWYEQIDTLPSNACYVYDELLRTTGVVHSGPRTAFQFRPLHSVMAPHNSVWYKQTVNLPGCCAMTPGCPYCCGGG